MRIRISIESAPIDVFRALTNFGAYREWNPWLKDIEGQAQEGTLVRVRPNIISLLGLRLTYRLEKIQPNDFLRWQEEGWFCSLFNTVREYQVYTRAGGGAIYYVRITFHGPLAGIVGLFYRKTVRRGLFREARALKYYCEAHYPLLPKEAR